MRKMVIMLVLFLFPSYTEADVVMILKNGQEIKAEKVWEENGNIKFSQAGSVASIQKFLVKQIVGNDEIKLPLESETEKAVRKLAGDIQKITRKTAGKDGQDFRTSGFVVAMRKANEKVLRKNGYNLSEILSRIAEKGLDEDDVLGREIIVPLISGTIYTLSNCCDLISELFKIYPEADAKSILKIMLAQNTKEAERVLPDYNVFTREKVDSLLRNKLEDMKKALVSGNIEKALQYFMPKKKDAYKRMFETSPETMIGAVKSIQKMEMTEFDILGQARYVVDFMTENSGKKQKYSSYLLFYRDKDGLWKIDFF